MKYHHALFLNPYIDKSGTSGIKLFPPTGLEYIATNSKKFVDKLTLLDLRYEKDFTQNNKLLDFISSQIDIVCVGIGWDRQLEDIYKLLNQIPRNVPLIVGGYTATEKVEELFEGCSRIDIIVRGEGEETLQEILSGKTLTNMLGVSYRSNGNIIHNANRPLGGIAKIAFPDRSMRRNIYRLTVNGIDIPHLTFDTVLSARGCPYKCKFCTFTLNPLGQKRNYVARSVESVIDEIEQIDARIILFSDDNFTFDAKRAEKICDLIIERKIKKNFGAQTRIDVARHPKLLEKMVKAGFKALLLGIESPHDRILKQLDKGFDSQTIRKYFSVLKKYPLFYHGYFIFGNIGETEEEMLYIADFAKEIKVDSIAFSKLRVDKYSPLKEIVEKTPGYHIADNGLLYSDQYSVAALKKIGMKIQFSFYNPITIFKILGRCFQVKVFTAREMLSIIGVIPLLIINAMVKYIRKGRLFKTIQAYFKGSGKKKVKLKI